MSDQAHTSSFFKKEAVNSKGKDIDSVIFDVDGVLIDTKLSYNTAIKKTVKYVLDTLNAAKSIHPVSDHLILGMRRTGGFNNDTDTSYALILAILVSQITRIKELELLFYDIINNIDAGGINSVERYLSAIYPRTLIEKIKHQLGYPGPVGKSIVTTVFDEVFYGTELFKQRHGFHPQHDFGEALIENDKVVISNATAKLLSKKFDDKMGVVSGRSKLAFEYSLQGLLSNFNKGACIFLEDEFRKYAKPNPYGIKRAMKVMLANSAIYVGDSIEDMIMVRKAKEEMGLEIKFLGVYGSSPKPTETRELLEQNGAEIVIRSVNQMPNILNKVM
jgi:HAD superfamily phosphatase